MPELVVLKTTDDKPLETYRQNLESLALMLKCSDRFKEQIGLDPAIVHHLEGSCCVGAYPREATTVSPDEWNWDPARQLLVPNRATPEGRALGGLVETICWEWRPLPGLEHWRVPLGRGRWPMLDLDVLFDNEVVVQKGLTEVDGALWACMPRREEGEALASGLWDRTRRSELIRALKRQAEAVSAPSLLGL